jgi:hypothetical protein
VTQQVDSLDDAVAKIIQAANEPQREQLKTDEILKEICNAQVN